MLGREPMKCLWERPRTVQIENMVFLRKVGDFYLGFNLRQHLFPLDNPTITSATATVEHTFNANREVTSTIVRSVTRDAVQKRVSSYWILSLRDLSTNR